MTPSLCENCHKRPKFGTHRFCGKTCAAQAAAKPVQPKQSQPQAKAGPRNAVRQRGPPPQKPAQLCVHCGQKPKFNGFDYCGKSCAALANAIQTKPPTTQGVPTTKQTTHTSHTHANNASTQGRGAARASKAPRTKAAAPQTDDSTEEDEEDEGEEEDGVSTDLDAYPSDPESESEDEANVPAVTVSQSSTKGTSKGRKPGSGAPGIALGTCAIPGCGQPSHVDRNGVKTRYCSVKHREDAVRLGLEAACIMCKKHPQSSSDYFCSSACRNQSMAKT